VVTDICGHIEDMSRASGEASSDNMADFLSAGEDSEELSGFSDTNLHSDYE
jgi:hypothetical protein